MAATSGSFGIKRIEYREDCMTCLECFRHWAEDITPAGRCPWEYQHSIDRERDVAIRKRKAVIAGLWG